ncbi:odorant receptor 4-like isoform X2 [Ceratina calcarata]|uniref:Odorant receptor n=1 Tax=Ceratina calcarata TaxID=156304 RepID=A0AAJ7J2C3_9HYME|nr:odorant receptor 4-like isoform X2 [Ceratina calcarata]
MNNNYQKNTRNSLKYCRLLLKVIGVWPLINGYHGVIERIVSMILIAACLGSLLFALLPTTYYCFFYVKQIDERITIFAPICYCSSCIMKLYYLCSKSTALKDCIEQMEEDWKSIETVEHQTIMLEKLAIANKSTLAFTILLYINGICYVTVLPLFSSPWSVATNATEDVKPLLFPGLDLFIDDIYSAPIYQMIYSAHCAYACLSVGVETALCGIMATFVGHARGMLQIQMALLEDMVVDAKNNKEKSLLPLIVSNHVGILTYAKRVAYAMQEICFLEVTTTTLLICTMEYLSIMAWRDVDLIALGTYVGSWISMTLNMFIICYAGDLLVEEGEKFGEATYNIEWYNLPEKKAQDLIILIGISRYPPKLTGGKIFEISIDTFSSVIKSSFVYLNLCQTVAE